MEEKWPSDLLPGSCDPKDDKIIVWRKLHLCLSSYSQYYCTAISIFISHFESFSITQDQSNSRLTETIIISCNSGIIRLEHEYYRLIYLEITILLMLFALNSLEVKWELIWFSTFLTKVSNYKFTNTYCGISISNYHWHIKFLFIKQSDEKVM